MKCRDVLWHRKHGSEAKHSRFKSRVLPSTPPCWRHFSMRLNHGICPGIYSKMFIRRWACAILTYSAIYLRED